MASYIRRQFLAKYQIEQTNGMVIYKFYWTNNQNKLKTTTELEFDNFVMHAKELEMLGDQQDRVTGQNKRNEHDELEQKVQMSICSHDSFESSI